MTIKVFKDKEATIKGLDVSVSFYERLMGVLHYFSSPEELLQLKQESPEEFQFHLETIMILFQSLDELALQQELVEDRDFPDEAPQESASS